MQGSSGFHDVFDVLAPHTNAYIRIDRNEKKKKNTAEIVHEIARGSSGRETSSSQRDHSTTRAPRTGA